MLEGDAAKGNRPIATKKEGNSPNPLPDQVPDVGDKTQVRRAIATAARSTGSDTPEAAPSNSPAPDASKDINTVLKALKGAGFNIRPETARFDTGIAGDDRRVDVRTQNNKGVS